MSLAAACRSSSNPPVDFDGIQDFAMKHDLGGDGSANVDGGDMAGDMTMTKSDMPDLAEAPDMYKPLFGEPAPTYKVDDDAQTIVSGDLDGDGNRDVVVVTQNNPGTTPSTLSVLLGNGDGTFKKKIDTTISDYPVWVTLADMDGDNKLDALVTDLDGFDFFKGNKDGTFVGPAHYVVVTSVANEFNRGGAVGDIDGDGNLDFVLADQGDDNTMNGVVWVVPGNGKGGFGTPVSFSVSTNTDSGLWRLPNALRLADMNNDKKLDIVTANSTDTAGTNKIGILVNSSTPGTPAFNTPLELPADRVPTALIVAQLDNANKLDIVTANEDDDTVSVYLSNTNDSTISYPAAATYKTAHGPYAVALADFDGDNNTDIAVADNLQSEVTVLYGDGAGKFNVASAARGFGSESYAVDLNPAGLVADTFNADVHVDVVTVSAPNDTISVLLNTRF